VGNLYCNSRDDVRSLLEASFSADGLLLESADLGENFFDLSSGLAGELFQTFNNYGKKLALVVSDTSIYSRSFQQLVLEHQYHSSIRFFGGEDAARQWLQDKQESKLKGIQEGIQEGTEGEAS